MFSCSWYSFTCLWFCLYISTRAIRPMSFWRLQLWYKLHLYLLVQVLGYLQFPTQEFMCLWTEHLLFVSQRYPVFLLFSHHFLLFDSSRSPSLSRETDCQAAERKRAAMPAHSRQTWGRQPDLFSIQAQCWSAVAGCAAAADVYSTLQGFHCQHASCTTHSGNAHTHTFTQAYYCGFASLGYLTVNRLEFLPVIPIIEQSHCH